MNILIVSATKFEIQHILSLLKHKKSYYEQLNKYSYDSHNIDVLITGIGMVQTAFWLGKTFSANKSRLVDTSYNIALNFGIAGSFDKYLQLGDVVQVTSDCFSELGAENGKNFIKIQDLQIFGNDKINNTLINNLQINNSVINKLKKVTGITVNTIHGEKSSIKKVKQLYAPDVESMEGAAFLYACLTEKVPNAQLRAVSNYVETLNKNKWQTKLAIENLNKIAIEILNSL